MANIKFGKILGTIVTVTALAVATTTMVKAEKVKWDKNGKPIIEKSKKPVKGCKQDLGFLDNNKTLAKDYNPADILKPKKKKECK